MHISLTAGSVYSNSSAMMFVYYKSTKTPGLMLFDAVGDLVWTSGCEK